MIFLLTSFTKLNASELINIVTTTHEIRWMSEFIGGSEVQASSLLTGFEDPHYIDAVPSHIQRVSRADIVCFIGLDLEVGWLPLVLTRSRNQRVQSGQPGYCELGSKIDVILDYEGQIDRSMGDVHPAGNPHFWLSPPHMIQASQAILEALIDKRPSKAEYFLANQQKLKQDLISFKKEVQEILKGFPQGAKISEYHKEFTYFFKTFGIGNGVPLEEVPGVPPSAGRIARVGLEAKRDTTVMALSTPLHPIRHLERFRDISGLPYLRHPAMMRGSGEFSDYRELLISLASQIMETLNAK